MKRKKNSVAMTGLNRVLNVNINGSWISLFFLCAKYTKNAEFTLSMFLFHIGCYFGLIHQLFGWSFGQLVSG